MLRVRVARGVSQGGLRACSSAAAAPAAADVAATETAAQRQDALRSRLAGLEGEMKAAQRELRALEASQQRAASGGDVFVPEESGSASFGVRPLVQSQTIGEVSLTALEDVTAADAGRTVTVRARLSTVRLKGKMLFFVLRQQARTLQGLIVRGSSEDATEENLRWVSALPAESIVDVTGELVLAKSPVKSCTLSDVELKAAAVQVVSCGTQVLPFQLADAASPVDDSGASATGIRVGQSTRLDNRWLDMRTPCNNAIWNVQAAVCRLFRGHLTAKGFVEIHTPKIIPAASESGATVFEVGYMGRPAFLAQSPQLYKQMAVQGDLGNVFEVGPVFRAEDSNTHRHLCEFTGLDVEMVIAEHYYEVLDAAEVLFAHIFDGLHRECAAHIAAVAAQYPHEPFVHLVDAARLDELGVGVLGVRESRDEYGATVASLERPSLRLSFGRGLDMLRASGREPAASDDLTTEEERVLGKLVRDRYGVDFYILDRYPLTARPFYTMPDAADPTVSNSYDMFMRGEEISSGAQRIHDSALLRRRCLEKGAETEGLEGYLASFKQGAWPHGGFGVGMERVVMLFLGLSNIRSCSLFPRDPKRCSP